MPTRITLLTVLSLFIPLSWADMVYKCKNRDGVMLYQAAPCARETQPVSSWAGKADMAIAEGSDSGVMVIAQSNGGHYFIDGAVNDHFLNFVVDTGATQVTLPQGLAASAGLSCMEAGLLNTANGKIRVCKTTIPKLKFGSFTLRDVEAIISPNLDQPLLGMNVLRRFRVEQDAGQMRLSRRY